MEMTALFAMFLKSVAKKIVSNAATGLIKKYFAQDVPTKLDKLYKTSLETAIESFAAQNKDTDVSVSRHCDILKRQILPTKAYHDIFIECLSHEYDICLLYTSPSPRDTLLSRMPSSA